ncbi:hypothetical protein [Spirosoma spitsbergense]|uniref:hypothetical protein n=1 Tax=Spirosoma spitsbergense TaxID=431554 RepID=UPI000378ECB6|nr:hypothetical protein [Spirosoma spitsbergense]
MEQQLSPIDYVFVDRLQQDMDRAGFTPIATSVGLRTLAKKCLIETFHSDAYGGEPLPACRIIEAGDEWVIKNQHLITFRRAN